MFQSINRGYHGGCFFQRSSSDQLRHFLTPFWKLLGIEVVQL